MEFSGLFVLWRQNTCQIFLEISEKFCWVPQWKNFETRTYPEVQMNLRRVAVDGAHCCDTSWSLRILIGQHSKAISSQQGCKLAFVKLLLYRSDVWIQLPTELASLTCTLPYLQDAYWVPNTHILDGTEYAWKGYTHTEGETRHRFITSHLRSVYEPSQFCER